MFGDRRDTWQRRPTMKSAGKRGVGKKDKNMKNKSGSVLRRVLCNRMKMANVSVEIHVRWRQARRLNDIEEGGEAVEGRNVNEVIDEEL